MKYNTHIGFNPFMEHYKEKVRCRPVSGPINPVFDLEEQKVTEPGNAQNKAEQLFHQIEARGLIRVN
jgi:hypothetical protein